MSLIASVTSSLDWSTGLMVTFLRYFSASISLNLNSELGPESTLFISTPLIPDITEVHSLPVDMLISWLLMVKLIEDFLSGHFSRGHSMFRLKFGLS